MRTISVDFHVRIRPYMNGRKERVLDMAKHSIVVAQCLASSIAAGDFDAKKKKKKGLQTKDT